MYKQKKAGKIVYILRAWFNGRTGASQASNTSSILVVRSFYLIITHYSFIRGLICIILMLNRHVHKP